MDAPTLKMAEKVVLQISANIDEVQLVHQRKTTGIVFRFRDNQFHLTKHEGLPILPKYYTLVLSGLTEGGKSLQVFPDGEVDFFSQPWPDLFRTINMALDKIWEHLAETSDKRFASILGKSFFVSTPK